MSPEEKPPKDSGSDSQLEPGGKSPAFIPPQAPKQPLTVSSGAIPSESSRSDVDPIVDAEIALHTMDDACDPVIAEMVESTDPAQFYDGAVINPTHYASIPAPPMAGNLENMSAKGGAIGSLVLGGWCVIGSFITNWSIINGVIGILMGFWGLTSRNQKTAWIGISLCLVGVFMSLIQVSELINLYFNAADEAP